MENEVAYKSKNYTVLFIILVIFISTLGILVYFIRFRTDLTPSADTLNISKSVSIANSYVFASPVRAKAGGDLIRVTVFVLDSEGSGLFDRKVSLKTDNALDVKEVQSLTDETGKAVFDVGSNVKQTFEIESFVDGMPLEQNLKIVFD